jgi:tetratricopeptide (TPR) repeat protein
MRNPEFAPAYLSAAFGYSRTANDEKTLEYLRLAFDKDPYNVLAYNMVNLWEQTFEHYQQLDDPRIDGLRYRFANREADVLSILVPPIVRGAWREYKQRYGFEPEPPVSFEVFSDSESFGIRSVGLPNIGLHGVCFGHVVTARSPSEGNFNYRIVYEHELSHVFTLQYSNYRIPRWLSEGIAEYDTYRTNESWRRTEDIALLKRLQEDQLTSVADLDLNFLRARSGGDMIAAYFQSFMITRFIAETYGGREGRLSLLRAFREGNQTPGAIEQAFGASVATFDTEFKRWLEAEYADLRGNFEPDVRVWADQHGGGQARAARGDVARALLSGDPQRIEAAMADFEAAGSSSRAELHFLKGVRAQQRTNVGVAISEFESALQAANAPSYSVAMRVARLLLERGNPSAALSHLENAAEAYPRGAEPHVMMARIYQTLGSEAEAVLAWKAAFERDPNDFDAAYATARALQSSDERSAAIEAAERATNIRPFSGEALRLYIGLLEADGRVEDVERARAALREVESSTSVGP